MRLVWRVDPAPTGRYRSFRVRGWPTAFYPGPEGYPAAFLSCDDAYAPWRVREGKHAPIKITILHHNDPNFPTSWAGYRLKQRAATLDEAKRFVERFVKDNTNWHPHKVRDRK